MSVKFCVSVNEAMQKRCCISLQGTCMVDRCMAWRWVETHIKDNAGDLTVLSGDTHGYCGLAGPPWKRD